MIDAKPGIFAKAEGKQGGEIVLSQKVAGCTSENQLFEKIQD
jgi:hypothetical protein